MNAEKASTLKLLKEGMGKTVNVVERKGSNSCYTVKAHLPDVSESSQIPILFLITSLAFLEANPRAAEDGLSDDYAEVDGWTPADFLSHLRFEADCLRIRLESVRGRLICTEVSLNAQGGLTIQTRGRGQSATRWIAFVRGRSHLQSLD